MLELIPLSLLLLSMGPASSAEALDVELLVPQVRFVLGEPVRVKATVRNVNDGSLKLVRGGRTGFQVRFLVERSDGLSWDGCRPEFRGRPRVSVMEVPAGWKKDYSKNFDCLTEPGEYAVGCVATSDGLAPGRTPDDGGDAAGAWTGSVTCAGVSIRIVEPEDLDREAFDYFGGDPLGSPDELLRRFPTSTYAGHVIVRGGPWPLDALAEVRMRGQYRKTAETDPQARDQMERLEEEQRALSEKRAQLLESYLEARPEFVYADFIRLELATRLAYLGDDERSRALCRQLIRSGAEEASRAAELLSHLD